MEEKIYQIAEKYCNEDLEWDETISIMMDMELSSMEFFSFISDVEAEFGVRISERQLKRIDTFGDLFRVIRQGS